MQCTPLQLQLCWFAKHCTISVQYLKCQDQRFSKNCRSTFIFALHEISEGAHFLHLACQGGRRAPLPPVSYATGSRGVAFSVQALRLLCQCLFVRLSPCRLQFFFCLFFSGLRVTFTAAFLNLFLPQHPFWLRLSSPAPPTIV